MLTEAQLKEVDEVLGEFCRREPPAHNRPELEYAVRIDADAATLVELRPAFRADIGRTESPVARFRFAKSSAPFSTGLPAAEVRAAARAEALVAVPPVVALAAVRLVVAPVAESAGEVVEHVTGEVASNVMNDSPAFSVQPGTQLRVTLSGTVGDADLYVRFGLPPTLTDYACRPYIGGSDEECLLTVPAGMSAVYVGVYGFTAAQYAFDIAYTPAAPSSLPGETCATAQELPLDGTPVQGSTVGYQSDATPCTGTAGPDRYYRFTLAQRSMLTPTLVSAVGDDYDYVLTGPATPSTCATATPLSCNPTSWDLVPGTYFLAVHGRATNQGAYDLSLSAAPLSGPSSGQGESCAGPVPLTLAADHATVSGTTAGHQGDRSGTCGGALSDVVYTVTTTRAGALTATVVSNTPTFRPVVYLQQAACTNAGNLKCNAAKTKGGTATFTTSNLAAGTYFLWVDGVGAGGGTDGAYSLDVKLQ